jgi:uncharacterized protein
MLYDVEKIETVLAKTGHPFMPPDMLNGFLFGVICSPEVIPISGWMHKVFFNETALPEFSSIQEIESVTRVLLDACNRIISAMGTDDFSLLVAEGAAKVSRESLGNWCNGFLESFASQDKEWLDDLSHEQLPMLLQIMKIAKYFLEKRNGAKNPVLSFIRTKKQILKFYDDLNYFVQDIYFQRLEQDQEKRRHAVQSKPQKTDPPKWGRNQPCPCGSGKKYKKCCGAVR